MLVLHRTPSDKDLFAYRWIDGFVLSALELFEIFERHLAGVDRHALGLGMAARSNFHQVRKYHARGELHSFKYFMRFLLDQALHV